MRLFRLLLICLLVVIPPTTLAFAQTATPTPTATPDYRAVVEVGMVELMAGSPPDSSTGWLVCDGSAVSRSTYALLFSIIGTTYGAGDGETTFNLPDLRGRVPVGSGAGVGLTGRTLGQSFGEETHLLTITEMPSHTHGVTDPGHTHTTNLQTGGGAGANNVIVAGMANVNSVPTPKASNSSTTGITIGNTGGGAAFNQMQPSLVLNYVIWSGAVPLSIGVNPDADIVVTVVVVFPSHTPTPTYTPSMTPTDGPSPTPTPTATPTGVSPYESVTSINGQPVLFEYRIDPGDAAIFGTSFLIVGLLIYALWMQIKRRRG